MKKIIFRIAIVMAGVVVAFVGFNTGKAIYQKEDPHKTLVQNLPFVKEIAAMATLEEEGVATFLSNNIQNDNSWTNDFREIFLQHPTQIEVPYTVRYGIHMNDSNFTISLTDTGVLVHLPKPTVLNFELHLDRMTTDNQKGCFVFQNNECYTFFQRKIYDDTRADMINNIAYLQQANNIIASIVKKYYEGLHLKVEITFTEL